MKQVLSSAASGKACFTLLYLSIRRRGEKERKCLWVISRASDNALLLSIPGKIP